MADNSKKTKEKVSTPKDNVETAQKPIENPGEQNVNDTDKILERANNYCDHIKEVTGRESYAPYAFVAGYRTAQQDSADAYLVVVCEKGSTARIVVKANLTGAVQEFSEQLKELDKKYEEMNPIIHSYSKHYFDGDAEEAECSIGIFKMTEMV